MKIVCLGDSCTYGQGVAARDAWPTVLERLTGHDVRNAGVCGDTTRLGLERFQRDVAMHRPDVVLVQFGHNDANTWDGLPRVSYKAFYANLWELGGRSASLGAAVWYLRPHRTEKDPAYNVRVKGFANMLDKELGEVIEPPAVSLLEDGYGVHPDEAMHGRYAEAVNGAL